MLASQVSGACKCGCRYMCVCVCVCVCRYVDRCVCVDRYVCSRELGVPVISARTHNTARVCFRLCVRVCEVKGEAVLSFRFSFFLFFCVSWKRVLSVCGCRRRCVRAIKKGTKKKSALQVSQR